ncbi:hypothetical protein [Cohnella sp. GCM10027633]|uniref:hypothetical protein n=1 Tax=unclassified Cohnella TaxID=2636738 RepID=UPI003629A5F6
MEQAEEGRAGPAEADAGAATRAAEDAATRVPDATRARGATVAGKLRQESDAEKRRQEVDATNERDGEAAPKRVTALGKRTLVAASAEIPQPGGAGTTARRAGQATKRSAAAARKAPVAEFRRESRAARVRSVRPRRLRGSIRLP